MWRVTGKISDLEQNSEFSSSLSVFSHENYVGKLERDVAGIGFWTDDPWNGFLALEYKLTWNRLKPFIC